MFKFLLKFLKVFTLPLFLLVMFFCKIILKYKKNRKSTLDPDGLMTKTIFLGI